MAMQGEINPEMKNLATFLVFDGYTHWNNEELKQALLEYQTNIPDPKEWSQEYPMYCSQATQDTPAWKDVYEDTSIWKVICKGTPPDDL
ncbi:hypothetical protein Goklo_024880, partial [Gossypium klotzschianum]|nr:hypothetical protein [Gossypium klotzschianum]